MRRSPQRSCRCMWRARRSPTPTRACTRPAAGLLPLRDRASPITSSASGFARRSSREGSGRRSRRTSGAALLRRLTEVEVERYLRRAFLGQKSFSIEGLDVMVPMLDEAIELAASDGARHVVMGMAHRGRLNVLAHIIGRSYETILREFEGEKAIEAVTSDGGHRRRQVPPRRRGRAQDVERRRSRRPRRQPEPPRVRRPGRRRRDARVADRSRVGDRRARPDGRPCHLDPRRRHSRGRASSRRRSTCRGSPATRRGALHLIANNQIGFTTDPDDGRSTRYSSDLAKGFDAPIIHVNADDAEGAIAAIRLAMAFQALPPRHRRRPRRLPPLRTTRATSPRTRSRSCTRRSSQSDSRQQFAARLVEAGTLSEEDVEKLDAAVQKAMRDAHETLKAAIAAGTSSTPKERRPGHAGDSHLDTAVPEDRLRDLNEELITVPDGFTVHPKLVKQLERRRDARGGRDGLGTDRGPRVRDAPHRRHSRPADRSGHGARHLLAPPSRPP